MNSKKFISCIVLGLLPLAYAHADSQQTKGNQSPTVKAGRDVTINYGISKEEVDKIVAVYAKQHQLDTEQIKALTTAITDLSQGKGVSGTASQIKEAIDALKQGQVTQAKALFIQETQRVELAAKQGAEAYRNLGALAYLDNTQEALQAYRRATQLDPGNADGWNQLGHLLSRVGDLDAAIAAYNTVLALGEKRNDRQEIAAAYGNLGIVYKTRGDLDKAIEFYQKALKLNEDLGSKEGMAANYGNLGNVYQTRGELDKAIEFHQKALKLNEDLGSKEGMAAAYGNLGVVYKTRGDLDKAIEFHQKALKLDEELGRKEGMANQYGNLGNVYKLKGNKTEAKRYYRMSIKLFKSLYTSPADPKTPSFRHGLPESRA
ncbi:MAG: tetratricopeptide repeat protein [Proteobacteria bacterium]|nr:tetratricopeptide repeat protein [Pseudomonadota bacterium]